MERETNRAGTCPKWLNKLKEPKVRILTPMAFKACSYPLLTTKPLLLYLSLPSPSSLRSLSLSSPQPSRVQHGPKYTSSLFYHLLFTLPLPVFYPAGDWRMQQLGLSYDVLLCSNYRKLQAVFSSRPLPFPTRETIQTGWGRDAKNQFGRGPSFWLWPWEHPCLLSSL